MARRKSTTRGTSAAEAPPATEGGVPGGKDPTAPAALPTVFLTEDEIRRARTIHTTTVGGSVYQQLLKQTTAHAAIVETAQPFAADFLHRLSPQDPIEEILACQLLWNHGRLMKLTLIANTQSQLSALVAVNAAADTAAATTRKLVRAFDEHRQPRRGGKVYAIQQANVAEKQIVNNVTVTGAEHGHGAESPAPAENTTAPTAGAPEAEVRTLSAGAVKAAGQHSAQRAVAAEYRAADGGRDGQIQSQCAAARGAVERDDRATAIHPDDTSTHRKCKGIGDGGGGDEH